MPVTGRSIGKSDTASQAFGSGSNEMTIWPLITGFIGGVILNASVALSTFDSHGGAVSWRFQIINH
jgi:hypothetical protein